MGRRDFIYDHNECETSQSYTEGLPCFQGSSRLVSATRMLESFSKFSLTFNICYVASAEIILDMKPTLDI